MVRHDRALKHAYKYGYYPNQPRVPAGDPDGGQWTEIDANGNPVRPSRFRLAGEIPTGEPPEIPKEMPATSKARTAALKAAARFGGPIGKLIEGAEWLRERSPLIEAYSDPPKTLDELQQAASQPGFGYDIRHIVRQDQDGHFSREAIDSPENKVRIPRLKHWEINGWYQTKNPEFGGESPQDYSDGRNWDVQRAVGLEALRKFGVLKP